jgi:hypothetical protein
MRETFMKVLTGLNSPWGTGRGHWRKQSGEEDLVVTPPFQIFAKMLNTQSITLKKSSTSYHHTKNDLLKLAKSFRKKMWTKKVRDGGVGGTFLIMF